MKTLSKHLFLGAIGGLIYICVELLWRGYSHWTMAVLGGVCFVIIGLINELFPWELGLLQQSLIGAIVVTALEFIAGVILNIWLGLGVWDYSGLPFNVLGQICLPFCLVWILLSGVAIVVDDILRYRLFNEEKPHYTII